MRRLLLTLAATAALAACAGEKPVRVLQDDGTEVLLSVANRTSRPAAEAAPPLAPEVEETDSSDAPAEPAAAEQAEPAPEPEPSAAEPAPQQVAAAPRPAPTADGIARAPDPFALEGGPATAVRAALGNATLHRREPPAEVWQYRTGACVLDVVLYPDGPNGALQVAHVAVRPVDAAPVDGRTCAAHVLAATPGRD